MDWLFSPFGAALVILFAVLVMVAVNGRRGK